jgi:hypothetical protein
LTHRERFLAIFIRVLEFSDLTYSDVRQVPDNQEVFLYPDSDISMIVEILQKVEPASLDDAIKYNNPA